MAPINIHIVENLKARSFAVLEKLGVTPSELMRETLQYVADNERIPLQTRVLTEEDAELLETARKRLRDPQRVKVLLDDL